MSRLNALRKTQEDKQFIKQFARIRTSLYHLREGGVLHAYLTERERITQKVNERMVAEEDDVLLRRLMDLRQFIWYANDQEAKVAECIWNAVRRDGLSEDSVAKSCSQFPIWSFSTIWVQCQINWHESRMRVERAQSPASEHNKTNKLMAIAWAIANN